MISFTTVLSLLVIFTAMLGNFVEKDVPPEGKLILIILIICMFILLIVDNFKNSRTLEYLVSKEIGHEMKNDELIDKWIQLRIKTIKVEIETEIAKEEVLKKYSADKYTK